MRKLANQWKCNWKNSWTNYVNGVSVLFLPQQKAMLQIYLKIYLKAGEIAHHNWGRKEYFLW